MSQIRNLRNLRAPHVCLMMLQLKHREIHKVQIDTNINDKGEAVPVYQTFVKNGEMDIVSSPDDPIIPGMLVTVEGRVVYRVVSIIESRPAIGDFHQYNFHPIWQRVEVEYYSLISNK